MFIKKSKNVESYVAKVAPDNLTITVDLEEIAGHLISRVFMHCFEMASILIVEGSEVPSANRIMIDQIIEDTNFNENRIIQRKLDLKLIDSFV